MIISESKHKLRIPVAFFWAACLNACSLSHLILFWDATLVALSCWGKRPVTSFSIMLICSAVWWLKTMWKTISCKQSSEIIWLVEEWYCQAPLLDIIEPLKWGSAAGCVVACSTSLFPRCDFVTRPLDHLDGTSTSSIYNLDCTKPGLSFRWYLFHLTRACVCLEVHFLMLPVQQMSCKGAGAFAELKM